MGMIRTDLNSKQAYPAEAIAAMKQGSTSSAYHPHAISTPHCRPLAQRQSAASRGAKHGATTPGAEGAVAVLEQAETLPAIPRVHRPQPAQRHILIVEDDVRAAHVIRDALQLEGEPGWSVALTSDGQQALELAYADPPHLVLLDMLLPGVNGAEVYRRLRTHPRTQQTRVLFVTAATSLDLYRQGVEGGAVLRKPFDVRELVSLVRALLAE